jgi:glycosyltransferase involved in cell wall biosynthesis
MDLSVVIPSYRDPLLIKTIDSLLENSELGKDLEIIAVLDGYEPDFELKQDPRVKYIKLGRNRGMRGAINAGVSLAKGKFIGRMDEHCLVVKGWDKVLTDQCQENWIISPRRYFLDPIKWEVMKDEGHVDYERLVIQDMGNGVRKFSGQPWRDRTKERENVSPDENQAIQGSFWVMPKKWWDEHIGELQTEGYGPTYQDSVEVCMKTWKAGGKLMLTKDTWYAHKHRSFPRTHNEGSPENPSNREAGWTYALSIWEQYYLNELLPKWSAS